MAVLAGVTVEDEVILRLAGAVNDLPLAHKLKLAHILRSQVINLTSAERKKILASLDDPRTALEGLRETLLENPAWRLHANL